MPDLLPSETFRETQIFGVSIYSSQKVENTYLILNSQNQKHRGLISFCEYSSAKSFLLSVYVLPKIFRMARHSTVILENISNSHNIINAELNNQTDSIKGNKFNMTHF